MTIDSAKKILITEYLSGLGINPVKIWRNDHWYTSYFRTESNPSFKVDTIKSLWYDHGLGEGGSIIDLGIKLHQCSLQEFLEKLSQGDYSKVAFSFHPPLNPTSTNKMEILSAGEVKSPCLKDYIMDRGIQLNVARKYCKEVEFQIGSKKYQAIGFENRSGGYELRNAWFKGFSTPKDISFIENGGSKISVVEGFFDFLSLFKINNEKIKPLTHQSDFLVLNSLSFLNRNHYILKIL